MGKSPGRRVVRRDIDRPRPGDLEITHTAQFTALVHALRSHIGAVRKPFGSSLGAAADQTGPGIAS